jgi:hypothetical protein
MIIAVARPYQRKGMTIFFGTIITGKPMRRPDLNWILQDNIEKVTSKRLL